MLRATCIAIIYGLLELVRRCRTVTVTTLSLYSLYTPCRLDTMSVCPPLSSLRLSRQPDQRTAGLSDYIRTCIRDYTSQTPFLFDIASLSEIELTRAGTLRRLRYGGLVDCSMAIRTFRQKNV